MSVIVVFLRPLGLRLGTDWAVVGVGKAKQSVATHKCTSCGAVTLACCSTKDSGDLATKGMDKKVEVAPLK